jgi:hypothetical protein
LKGFTLDAGALIAVERGDQRVKALLDRMIAKHDAILHVPAGVVAQVFRDGPRQVRLTKLLNKPQTRIVPLDARMAYITGLLLGRRGGSDVVDASVVVCARRYHQPVLTSDVKDLRRLDHDLLLEEI